MHGRKNFRWISGVMKTRSDPRGPGAFIFSENSERLRKFGVFCRGWPAATAASFCHPADLLEVSQGMRAASALARFLRGDVGRSLWSHRRELDFARSLAAGRGPFATQGEQS